MFTLRIKSSTTKTANQLNSSTQTMTAAQENYSLRWKNHQSHILQAFDALLQQNSLVDVTLVCSDRSLRAHKVVLSACSPFFEKVFNDTPCKHPVIVLKDFRGWLVQAIVDFMYRGEISVPQEKLNHLIQAGESLQVRGLVGAVPYTIPIESDVESAREACASPMPRRKQARPRRSGDLTDIPQDLSNGTVVTKREQDDPSTDTDEDDVELHEIGKRVRLNGTNDDSKIHNDDNNNGFEGDETPENEEKENHPGDNSTDVPENLCMKKPSDGSLAADNLVGDKNNNNDANGSKKRLAAPQNDFHERFILSLKDLRHLRHHRQGPPGHPFSDILSHLPISPPPSFHIGHQESKDSHAMKIDSDHSDNETSSFSEQMDLAQHRNQLNSNLEKLSREHQKHQQQMMNHQNMGMPPFPPQFHQGSDGQMRAPGHHGHHSSSPLSFPSVSSVSALTLTPPHSKFSFYSFLSFPNFTFHP